jgi:hypothetical protein
MDTKFKFYIYINSYLGWYDTCGPFIRCVYIIDDLGYVNTLAVPRLPLLVPSNISPTNPYEKPTD